MQKEGEPTMHEKLTSPSDLSEWMARVLHSLTENTGTFSWVWVNTKLVMALDSTGKDVSASYTNITPPALAMLDSFLATISRKCFDRFPRAGHGYYLLGREGHYVGMSFQENRRIQSSAENGNSTFLEINDFELDRRRAGV